MVSMRRVLEGRFARDSLRLQTPTRVSSLPQSSPPARSRAAMASAFVPLR